MVRDLGLHGEFCGRRAGAVHARVAAATRPGWWIIAACGLAVIVLALLTTGRRGRASATKIASLVAAAEATAEKVPAAALR